MIVAVAGPSRTELQSVAEEWVSLVANNDGGQLDYLGRWPSVLVTVVVAVSLGWSLGGSFARSSPGCVQSRVSLVGPPLVRARSGGL